MKRCIFAEGKSEIYKKYHDYEWGIPSYDDNYLFEMLILESFHCGLSFLLILNKRKYFKEAFDNFDYYKIKDYKEDKINSLLNDKNIVRNKAKIMAAINNAEKFIEVQREFASFSNYIWSFTNNKIIYLKDDKISNKNELSNIVSKDMKKRGFKFMGSVTTYSYLEAIGVMNNHITSCFKHKKKG